MIKINLFLMLISISTISLSQSISLQIISSAGVDSNEQLIWTVGEPIISTLENASNILTQGFHQSETIIIINSKQVLFDFKVNIYPNPTVDMIFVKLSNVNDFQKMKLFDMQGNELYSILNDDKKVLINISLANYPDGSYVLNLYNYRENLTKSILIEKISNH